MIYNIMKPEYLQHLKENVKLEVQAPISTSNDHHMIKCMLCDNMFTATPKSKVANYKKWGATGCPVCTRERVFLKSRDTILNQLDALGIVLSEKYVSNKHDTRMKNTNCCSREFTAKPNNVLMGSTICPPCNDDRKRQAFQDFNKERHEEALKHMEGFQRYTKLVRVLTEQTYRDHHETINPDNHSRKRSGQDGYHLDHIYSIYRCYHDGVPEDVCAHPDNLQMLEWKVNAMKYNKVDHIPSVVQQFVTN